MKRQRNITEIWRESKRERGRVSEEKDIGGERWSEKDRG
jgi:hypothetical protein